MLKLFLSLILIIPLNIPEEDLPYYSKFGIACHNCYEPEYAKGVEEVLSYTRTIEIDIWDSEIYSGYLADIFGANRMEYDWYVKHEFNRRGNFNSFGSTLRDCLTNLRKWSDRNQDHDVITVFLDKEENWSEVNETRNPNDLDKLLLDVFTEQKIFTVNNLLNGKTNLRESVPNNWPDVVSLKNKFIFVITDANSNFNTTNRKILNEYLNSQKNNAICFVCPEIFTENQIKNPHNISQANYGNVVFLNMKYNYRYLSEKINSFGYLSRVYGGPETLEVLNDLKNKKVNFIAMYDFKIGN